MNIAFRLKFSFVLAALAAVSAARAEEFEAVSSRVSPGYARHKRPDGSFQPEAYAFGNGGYYSGPIDDLTIDRMGFMDVARIIAVPLASQGYVPARDPAATRLLVMVYWGTTYAPEHASESPTYDHLVDAIGAVFISQHMDDLRVTLQMEDNEIDAIREVQRENHRRDLTDARNAMMLGYDSWWNTAFEAQSGTPLELRKRDMLNELEEDRYFVVLLAYDFQLMRQKKQRVLLWETRFSIRQHVNQFNKALPAMALEASKYFGQDSGGLVHDTLPEARVDIGEVKNLGEVRPK
jgi:hypothetical protein